MIETIFLIIICHLIGDYVLQSDFIARSKGENLYHLLVHCILYTVPFYIFFGFDWRLYILLYSHIFIDAMKAKFGYINYVTDQVLHYIIAFSLYLLTELS